MFQAVNPKQDFVTLEHGVLDFWAKRKIFEKLRKQLAGKPRWSFLDGPITANNPMGVHHAWGRTLKDLFQRYFAMQGFNQRWQNGFDCQGLWVEVEVEKELKFKAKKDIEKYGVGKFVEKCKERARKYAAIQTKQSTRLGQWMDWDNSYYTMSDENNFAIWHFLKTCHEQGNLYKGRDSVPWCPRCGTGLSSHELALGYKETTDISVYVKFKAKPGVIKPAKGNVNNNFSILSWTTTPWTLPGNVALAIGKNIVYAVVKYKDEYLLLAKDLIKQVFGEDKEIIQEIKGEALIGLEYEPLFDIPILRQGFEGQAAYKIYPADFVTTTDGTGVVHTAVMYGEDDYKLGKEVGLPQYHTVDEQGRFVDQVKGFGGMLVKSKDGAVEKETTDKIFEHLKSNNNLLKTEEYKHEYPFCWRCSTPLIYYARDSWFIAMSKLRAKLQKANKNINWVPENIRDGRFGEWIKEVKDWAISRERYWGTPLPIWHCEKCRHFRCIGSLEELEDDGKKKEKNRYIVVRHGGAENNLKDICDSDAMKSVFNLTLEGRVQVEALAKKLKKEKIDIVFSSDFPRTKETAEILQSILGLGKINLDARLREINVGDFNGQPDKDYQNFCKDYAEKFVKRPPQGENLTDLRSRLFDFVNEKEKEFSGKTFLIVSHEYSIWMLASILEGWGNREAIEEKNRRGEDFIANAGMENLVFRHLPRNENGETDLHRPYLDNVKIVCDRCGGGMERIKEVLDVWFDSGAMPFAQAHYPFNKTMEYPADYISEAMDQTRGWFYTLLAIGVLMGKNSPYKNVICLGLILDRNGQKMSKSKGNIVDPWEMMAKHAVDAIRWYFFTVNPPGEPKKFDELEIAKTSRQLFSLLYNSFLFFETYRVKNSKFNPLAGGPNSKSLNVLDRWILSRLHETISLATENLDKFNIGDAGRAIENFVGDLSRWYIRRSRSRFQKPDSSAEGQKDHEDASSVLSYALLETSKLIAPFAPFFAEALYKSLNAALSVHLEDWPKTEKKYIDKKLSLAMDEARKFASAILAKRAEVGIKVRQPLQELRIKNNELWKQKELLDILKDEINVKEIVLDAGIKEDFELDTNITHELKEEGILRELTRAIQGFRQDMKLKPQDIIGLFLDGPDELKIIVSKYGETLKKDVKAESIELKRSPKFDAELETKVDEMPVWIGIKK